MSPNHPLTLARVAAERADLLAEWIADAGDTVRTLDDVRALPEVAAWRDDVLGDAVDRLVTDGRLREDAHGRLRIWSGGERL